MENVLNQEVIAEILSITGEEDPDLLLDLIGLFVEDAPVKLSQIETALGRDDQDELLRCLHALRGTAGTLGLDDLHNDCLELESTRAPSLDSKAFRSLRHHLLEGIRALEALRQQYS